MECTTKDVKRRGTRWPAKCQDGYKRIPYSIHHMYIKRPQWMSECVELNYYWVNILEFGRRKMWENSKISNAAIDDWECCQYQWSQIQKFCNNTKHRIAVNKYIYACIKLALFSIEIKMTVSCPFPFVIHLPILTSNTSSSPILINSFLKCNLKSRSSGLLIIAFISVIHATLSASLLQINSPGNELI